MISIETVYRNSLCVIDLNDKSSDQLVLVFAARRVLTWEAILPEMLIMAQIGQTSQKEVGR